MVAAPTSFERTETTMVEESKAVVSAVADETVAVAPDKKKPGPKAKDKPAKGNVYIEPVRNAIWDINAKRCNPEGKEADHRIRVDNRWITTYKTKRADRCELPVALAEKFMRNQQAMPWRD